MSQTIMVLENEEAAHFLDYFVAYKKIQSKIEYVKCLAAVNSEVTLNLTPPIPDTLDMPELELQPATGLIKEEL